MPRDLLQDAQPVAQPPVTASGGGQEVVQPGTSGRDLISDFDPVEAKAQALADSLESMSPSGEAGAGELFGNAFVLGLKDKVAGAAGAAGAIFKPDMTMAEGYKIHRRAQEIIEERARERTGKVGMVAEIAGTVGTGVLAHAPVAATSLARIWQAAREAGTLGAIQGAGDSKGETGAEILEDIAKSGITSMAAGGVLSGIVESGRAVIKGVGAAGRGIKSATDDDAVRAANRVYKSLIDDGLTPEQALARMSKRETALINVGGENTLGVARAAAAQPGEGRQVLNKALDAQQKASRGKVMTAVDDALGGGDQAFNKRVADMVQTRSNLGANQYGAAFAKNFDNAKKGAQETLESLLPRVPREALTNAQKIAQADGAAFGRQLIASIDDAGNVSFARTPTLEEWHFIQRGLRSAKDSAYRGGVGEVGNAYNQLHKKILGAMDDASSLYAKARKSYAGQSDMIDAIQRGREILNPSNTRNADALASEIADLSKAEREMVKVGLARQIQDMIDATPDKAGDMVNKIFGTAAKRNAIRAAFDSDGAFRKFQSELGKIAKETETFRFVRTGSRTSFVDAEKADAGALADAGAAVADAATGGLGSTILRGTVRFLKNVGGMDDKVAAEVAKILVEQNPDVVRKALSTPATKAAGKQARAALLAKANPFIRALTVGSTAGAGTEAGLALSGPR